MKVAERGGKPKARRKVTTSQSLDQARRLQLCFLGEIQVLRDDEKLALPPSKKTRALLAYLVLTGRAQRREHLCSLFWDVPDDPRGALRWSLSKLRPLLDDPDHTRLIADREHVRFEAAGAHVDAVAVRSGMSAGCDDLSTEELLRLAGEFKGELLEGLELTEFHGFYAWCVAEREQLRRWHTSIRKLLVERLRSDPEEALPHARALVGVDPLDVAARQSLVELLAATGRAREAQQQCEIGSRMLSQLGRAGSAELDALGRKLHEGRRHAGPAVRPDGHAASARSEAEWYPASEERGGAFVGRQQEREALLHALDEAARSRKLHAVLVTGESGIGKTRVLQELLAEARSCRATALFGCAYEVERGHPYVPWIEALRQVHPSVLGRPLADELAPLLRHGAAQDGEDSSRERLFGAVVELFAVRAHHGAVVLALDDVQWCDPASIALLHYVIRMNRHRAVVVAMAARAGELADNTAALRFVRQLRREAPLAEIDLAPLTREETAALVATVASGLDTDEIFAGSAGNPLFALELARSRAQGPNASGHSLYELVRERLDRLPGGAAETLRWAAVLGPAFRTRRLAALVDLDGAALLDALKALETHGLLRAPHGSAHPGDDYVFAHQLVHQVTYTDLSEPRRRLMHLRVAEIIESAADRDEDTVNELVHHAVLAGEHGMAARACVTAGRRCLRLFANTEAHGFARRGLHYAEHVAGPQRIPLLVDLTEISVASRKPEDLDAAARDIEALAERALDSGFVEHACRGFHLVGHLRWEYGDWSDAQRQLLRAEAVSRSAGDAAHIVAMAEAGRCLAMLERDLAHAESLAVEARARAQRAGIDPMAIPQTLGMLRLHRGKLDEAEGLLRQSLLAAGRDGDHLGEFQALEHLAMLEWQRESYDGARSIAAELHAIAAKLPEGSEAPFARALGALALYVSDAATAGPQLDAALAALRIADAKHRLAYSLTRAAQVDLREKRTSLARSRVQEALQLASAVGRPSETLLAHVVLARVASERGDGDEARRHVEAIEAGAERLVSAEARRAADLVLRSLARSKTGERQDGARRRRAMV